MPSLIDKRIHAALETLQHEALLRIEGVVEQLARQIQMAASDAVAASSVNDMFGQSQRRTADILKGIIPEIASTLDTMFRRLQWWSYSETVATLARHIPRRWFRRVIPQAVLVGEADGMPIPGTDLWADTFTEPVAGRRLSDEDWQQFLRENLFPPPSREEVDAVIYAPVAGMNWQQRLDVLSHKITDMDKLAGLLSTGASSGMSQAELKRQIQPIVQGISSSAARIARTEGLRIANQTQRSQYSQLGDMLAGVQIVATLDENTRPHHAARNGRIYWNDPRKKPNIDELPDLPDEANCRCYEVPVLHPPEEFESDPELRAEFANADNQAIPDPQVYSQWFNAVDPGRRKMAVGSTRYRTVEKKLGRPPEFADFIGTDGELLPVNVLKRETPRQREQRLQQVSQLMLQRQELLTKVSRVGFVSTNWPEVTPPVPEVPDTPSQGPFHRGITAPVSKALDPGGTKKQQEIVKAVLGVIDAIHGDGDLPRIPVTWSRMKSRWGAYAWSEKPTGESTATSIAISVNSPHPMMTAAHEIGHFIDQQGIGSKRFATGDSTLTPLMGNLMQAIQESQSIQSLRDLLVGPSEIIQGERKYKIDANVRKHLRYLLTKQEQFARAYAQYIAVKGRNKTMLEELSGMQPQGGDTIEIRRHWTDDDFQPIARAFDELFSSLGWLR